MAREISEKELLQRLEMMRSKAGSTTALAEDFGVSYHTIYKIFEGSRNFGPTVLKGMGIRREYRYVYFEEELNGVSASVRH